MTRGNTSAGPRADRGFTLVEAMVAMFLLTVGLLGLAQVFALGVRYLSASSPALIAREKAREAIESVHTARDTGLVTWTQINNTDHGGVFVVGPQPLYQPGADGMVNTADDGSSCSPSTLATPCYEAVIAPGDDATLGTDDDLRTELTEFTREIQISELTPASPTLRRLRVIIRFRTAGFTLPPSCIGSDDTPMQLPGCYVLTTFVSSYS